jgi:hypothetical protein
MAGRRGRDAVINSHTGCLKLVVADARCILTLAMASAVSKVPSHV